MNDNEFEGAARNVAGKVQGAVGALSGDTAQELKGRVTQAAGTMQQKAGAALGSARDFGASNPIGTALFAGAVGFVLGVLFSRRD
jgi:uncharacterized protein YjbJ (UPF0337 family)